MTSHDQTCNCCAGTWDHTPVKIENRPGLGEIAYRSGDYRRFRESMIAGLSRNRTGLSGLRTRDGDDFSLALIDAWATVGDVLTFYTERTANEHYIGTATERRSVADLVNLIGYRLGPGLAATAMLAFAVDIAPGSPARVPIAAGSKIQTAPGPDELPQTYETAEPVTALRSWNRLDVNTKSPQVLAEGDTSLVLSGAATGLNPGDSLLIVAAGGLPTLTPDIVRVTTIATDPARQETTVTFQPKLSGKQAGANLEVYAMRQRAALFGYNAPSPLLFTSEVKTAIESHLDADKAEWKFSAVSLRSVDLDSTYEGIAVGSPVVLVNGNKVVAARVASIVDQARSAYAVSAKVTRLALDIETRAFRIPEFGGSSTRSSMVLVRGESLTLAQTQRPAPIFGDRIDLVDAPEPIDAARTVLIRGRRARFALVEGASPPFELDYDGDFDLATAGDLVAHAIELDQPADPVRWVIRFRSDEGTTGTVWLQRDEARFLPARVDDPLVGEAAVVTAVEGSALVLSEPLANAYDRFPDLDAAVTVWGNVARATHGESIHNEVLGSGDGSRPFQQMSLRRPWLTQVPAATATGSASTLEVRINNVQWSEVESLYGAGPRDRVFVADANDEGVTRVTFGDGVTGARPPTGQDNVRAEYRVGIGRAGSARADQLTLLMTRPLGVRGVTNPLPAFGAQDPQSSEQARINAPKSLLTLGRVVSLQDYEDFAANFGSVGKAHATWTWDGRARGVLLTVAGIDGEVIPQDSEQMDALHAQIVTNGDPHVPLAIRSALNGRFSLRATLVLDPAQTASVVIEQVKSVLIDRFSFARRNFGQGVALSEIALVIYGVPGVIGASIDQLHRNDEMAVAHAYIPAASTLAGSAPPSFGAELLTIDPGGIVIEEGS